MNSNVSMYLKFAAGFVLFVSWVLLTAFKVQADPDLIQFIKYVLVGLATHLLTAAGTKAPPPFPGSTTPTT